MATNAYQPQQTSDTIIEVVHDKRSEAMRKSAMCWSLLTMVLGNILCACVSIPAFIASVDRGMPIAVYMRSRKKSMIAFIIMAVILALVVTYEIYKLARVLMWMSQN